ncbi:MAG: hypothetical protein KAH10_00150 [Flavobacteriales bacterium]|nr:hypothetical protein [Flavobacteriales bacterium]
MKFRLIITLLFLGIINITQAQDRQADTTSYRTIIPENKQSLLKNIDMIANMQLGFRNDYQDGEYLGSKYKFEQFRLEIKGYVHENVYFRFRHRYTSDFQPQSIDKIIKGVDFAYLRINLSEKWQFTLGKTYADWGGIEFDINPIEIYEYSDIIEMADNFLTGAGIYYQATSKHGFSIQILNSRTANFDEIYGTPPPPFEFEASKIPLAGVINWRGSFLDGKFTTIWSYSIFTEAKDAFKNYIALGNQLKLDKLTLAYDFKWSKEDLDRTGIISNDVHAGTGTRYAMPNTLYYSHWAKIDYRLTKKWQLSFVGFMDVAEWKENDFPGKDTDDFRTAWGYIPTVEYFPWEDMNFKFFAGFIGRSYNYSDYAKEGLEVKDYNTGRIVFGIISPLNIL